jgi:hypothetical protein
VVIHVVLPAMLGLVHVWEPVVRILSILCLSLT